jgi:hypothetical protein
MTFGIPACEDCRNSTRGYDALLCTYGVVAKTVQTNRDIRGVCTPAGLKFSPKVKK